MGGNPAHGREFGTRWHLRSLPIKDTLWFHDCMILYVFYTDYMPSGQEPFLSLKNAEQHYKYCWSYVVLNQSWAGIKVQMSSWVWSTHHCFEYNLTAALFLMVRMLVWRCYAHSYQCRLTDSVLKIVYRKRIALSTSAYSAVSEFGTCLKISDSFQFTIVIKIYFFSYKLQYKQVFLC